jgi:hypothetical protein
MRRGEARMARGQARDCGPSLVVVLDRGGIGARSEMRSFGGLTRSSKGILALGGDQFEVERTGAVGGRTDQGEGGARVAVDASDA